MSDACRDPYQRCPNNVNVFHKTTHIVCKAGQVFSSQRGQTYSGKYAKAKAVKTIPKMKAKRIEQHVRYFLVRSDNAICLPGKTDCVKIGKEKKQVYVLKEYLCTLYKKYCAENPRKKINFSRFCNKRPTEIKLVKYAQRMVYLCFKYTNFALKLKAFHGLTILILTNL